MNTLVISMLTVLVNISTETVISCSRKYCFFLALFYSYSFYLFAILNIFLHLKNSQSTFSQLSFNTDVKELQSNLMVQTFDISNLDYSI